MITVHTYICFLLAALLFTLSLPPTASREVTNEDIRDVILNLAHTVRSSEDKLERHELRERQLGEILKKALIGLDKRHRNIEPIKGTLSRIDERLAGVETILMQRDERERIQLQKTNDALDDIKKRIDAVASGVASLLVIKPSEPVATINVTQITDNITSQFKNVRNTIDTWKHENEAREKVIDTKLNLLDVNTKELLNKSNLGIKSNEILLDKYEKKLSELNNKVTFTEMSDTSKTKEQEKWIGNVLTDLEKHRVFLEQISNEVKNSADKVDRLPKLNDITLLNNNTLDMLQELKYELKINTNQTAMKIDTKLSQIENTISDNYDAVNKGVSDLSEISENVYTGMTKSYEQLRGEVQSLGKVEKVMIQTADNVLDTKRRIEYGVHQILLEVGDVVKLQAKDLNATMNKRFDNIETTILDNHIDAQANLTTKIETEMSQVWRQIGIMYQQLTASNTALDKLQEQTEIYVNGSLSTMDSMEGKVGQITGRMAEVDDHLNYLLGRLGLVTQEFNMIKTGLGSALDNIRNSFLTVQNQIKDVGPGPHKISDIENETTDKTSRP